MSNVIAVIWDCDRTLIDGYMEDPIFEEYGVNETEFWKKTGEAPAYYASQGVKVNPDTIYLNYFIREARKGGCFAGLNNAKLREFGKKQKYYPGIPNFLRESSDIIRNNPAYSEYGIIVEHYIVSTGLTEIIRGSELNNYVKGIWGCELIEQPDEETGEPIISEIGYTIDNTTKTRAIFEINKGIPVYTDINVNSSIPEENRRVHFKNMIYIADGPSDIPAFSLVHRNGGATFAIYPHGDQEAMKQVEQMREDGRVDMYAEADYSKDTTAWLWINGKIQSIADRILKSERNRVTDSAGEIPRHLNT
ncbi:MAG: haloacid dehalogenase-like hydrolase [Lachnospiraceae bacterium]|jgi:hypothetical protein